MLDHLVSDIRYALRIFRRSPGFVATAVLSLAVGIAAATGLFSVVYAVLLNPFPYTDADRIVRLAMLDNGRPRGLFLNARQLVALRQSEVLDGVVASDMWPMTLTGQDLPEAVDTQYFSANGLTVLGVPPLLGRVFTEADGPPGVQPERVVVLTYRFWQRHFGGRAEAVGQTLHLNREPYTVIGVLPRAVFFHRARDHRSDPSHLRSGLRVGRPGPAQAGCRCTRRGSQTSAALRAICPRGAAALSQGDSRPGAQPGGDAPRRRVRADTRLDFRRRHAAAAAGLRQRLDPAAGARHLAVA